MDAYVPCGNNSTCSCSSCYAHTCSQLRKQVKYCTVVPQQHLRAIASTLLLTSDDFQHP
jgi:hypothetical protein